MPRARPAPDAPPITAGPGRRPWRTATPSRTGLLALAALAATSVPGRAQIPTEAPLPTDEAVTVGELDNGLRYYVRRNAFPEERAELRLVVNAGSVLEDDTQLGLAHLVEHMAFNGTEHFERQELVEYLESIGMEFGPSVNAYTSFDETVYMLQVPTDDPEIVETGFQILEDWAHAVTLEPEEIDQERGVVIEEWRLGRGAGARIRDQQFPIMFEGSRYARRLPIGDVEVLETFPHEELIRFYETWYRPDLMAVVAVGDFDPAAIEATIREHFGRIPPAEGPMERPLHGVPDRADTAYAIATDPEATSAQVALLTLQDPPSEGTVGDFRRGLVESLASGMLNDRFRELAQQADPPFMFAGTGRGRFVRTKSAYQLLAAVPEDGHRRGLEAILTEAERAARHGFTETELERQKLDLLRARERRFADRENQPSARWASEYVAHFLEGEPIPGIEFEYRAAQALVPGITLEEVNAVARENLAGGDPVILVSGIEKPGVDVPTEDDLRDVFASVAASDIEPWEDTAVDEPLVAEEPTAGSIASEETLPDVGVTIWRLENGATVWLKPTDFKDDEIVLQATSPGGWSRSTLGEHLSASNAATLVQLGGAGPFSSIDLGKALAGKAAGASAFISETREGLSGSASPKDLETLFEMIWLRFTAPRMDETAFQAFLAQNRAGLQNRNVSPMAAFSDTIAVTMAQHHPRVRPPTVEMLDELDLGEAMAFYRDRFASADDFTFFFVGALDPATMRPLVEKWIASLPATDRDDDWVDLDIDPPDGVVEKVVRAGIEPQSRTRITFTGPFDYEPETRLEIRALAGVLETRLREVLREDLGGTYSVGVNAGYDEEPEEDYTFRIDFGSDPERADELRAAVFEEIRRLKEEGPDEADVRSVLETERRSGETNRQSNGWWASQLRYAVEAGEEPGYLLDDDRYDAVTPATIQEAARRYLDEERYVVVVLLPRDTGA